jgi:hypothetical protein
MLRGTIEIPREVATRLIVDDSCGAYCSTLGTKPASVNAHFEPRQAAKVIALFADAKVDDMPVNESSIRWSSA